MVKEALKSSIPPENTAEKWNRIQDALKKAQESLPNVQPKKPRKWESSTKTLSLVEKRKYTWDQMSPEEWKEISKEIGRSARDDYRDFMEGLIEDMEKSNAVGNITEIYKLTKQLSTKKKGNAFCQPSKDHTGAPNTSIGQQLEPWATFLEQTFAARPGMTQTDLHDENEEAVPVPEITLEEVKTGVALLKSRKATGPDSIPIEQFKNSKSACKAVSPYY